MNFDNHIVTRFLTDIDFQTEILIDLAASNGTPIEELKDSALESHVGTYILLNADNNKNYYVSKSVMDKLPLLDTKKCMDIEGWKLFNDLPLFKKTFIIPDDEKQVVVRVIKTEKTLAFCHLTFKYFPKEKRTRYVDGESYYIFLFVDLEKGELAEHFNSDDGKSIAPLLYSLMCYVELCDNEEITVQPKTKYGTKKTGNFINTLPFPVTVINNTWNITSIRVEGFPVRGHSAIYHTGPGRTIPKLLYKEPFMKHGYIRKSGKELQHG